MTQRPVSPSICLFVLTREEKNLPESELNSGPPEALTTTPTSKTPSAIAMVHLYLELPPGPQSSQSFMKQFKVSIQTELKLFCPYPLAPNLYQTVHSTEFYTN